MHLGMIFKVQHKVQLSIASLLAWSAKRVSAASKGNDSTGRSRKMPFILEKKPRNWYVHAWSEKTEDSDNG